MESLIGNRVLPLELSGSRYGCQRHPRLLFPSFGYSPLNGPMPFPTKPQLRLQLRNFRRAITAHDQRRAQLALIRQFLSLPNLAQARRVALYVASDGEIDPAYLAQRLINLGIEIYLPWLKSKRADLAFSRYHTGDKLIPNCFGIAQPLPKAQRLTAGEIDILGLPLVGFAPNGNRLGMGGGFYDRALAKLRDRGPVLVGLAHHGQQCTQLPVDPWDIPVDWIATDKKLICSSHIRRFGG